MICQVLEQASFPACVKLGLACELVGKVGSKAARGTNGQPGGHALRYSPDMLLMMRERCLA